MDPPGNWCEILMTLASAARAKREAAIATGAAARPFKTVRLVILMACSSNVGCCECFCPRRFAVQILHCACPVCPGYSGSLIPAAILGCRVRPYKRDCRRCGALRCNMHRAPADVARRRQRLCHALERCRHLPLNSGFCLARNANDGTAQERDKGA